MLREKEGSGIPEQDDSHFHPFSAGGAADLSVRALQPKLEKELGQSVEVIDKPGGSGALAMNEVIKSAADGYTLGFTGVGPAVITPLSNDVGYTPEDFATVGAHMLIPYVLVVPYDSKYENLSQFLDEVKANPNKIRIGTPGPASTSYLALQQLAEKQGLQFQIVPFNGGVDTINALLGSNVEAIVNVDSELPAYLNDKKFKTLTVLSDKRSTVVPDTPTSAEQGIDFTINSVPPNGLYAPKGTPANVIAKLEKAIKAATEDEEVKKTFQNIHINPEFTSAADFRKAIDDSYAYYKEILKK
ncbi:tripartite tricarboxylate transporter substrate binding protein [Cohnella faecalis]|uniref:Tripartite tricarboxylate transporter substrate binding protein n=1 Tax=Cohnella faecalis TaxID=2315694 RepID=A0A398CTQ8_9BACL|nr:tripartite tricarboxylate transporter substrate binding protein [Cohnella faecalis]